MSFILHLQLAIASVIVFETMGSCTNGVMNVGEPSFFGTETGTATDTDSDTPGDDTASVDEPVSTNTDTDCKGGVSYENLCWFLGDLDESCMEVCAERGGIDETAASIIGSPEQSGTWTACRDIVRLLGILGEVAAGYRTDGAGLGCHIWDDGEIWWLYSPDFDPGARMPNAQLVCGCKSD